MVDKIVAVFALLTMIAFVSVVIIWVPEPSLIIVCVIVMAMAAGDFYRMLVIEPNKKKKRQQISAFHTGKIQ